MSIVPTNINNYLRQFAYQLEERILQQFPPLHRELPMGVRKSETVALVHPVMPVGDGFGGRDIGINSHQL
jgi:hypothetical protein